MKSMMVTYRKAVVILLLFISSFSGYADEPPPGPPGGGENGGHDLGGNQGSTDVPLGDGELVLILLGLGYTLIRHPDLNTKAPRK